MRIFATIILCLFTSAISDVNVDTAAILDDRKDPLKLEATQLIGLGFELNETELNETEELDDALQESDESLAALGEGPRRLFSRQYWRDRYDSGSDYNNPRRRYLGSVTPRRRFYSGSYYSPRRRSYPGGSYYSPRRRSYYNSGSYYNSPMLQQPRRRYTNYYKNPTQSGGFGGLFWSCFGVICLCVCCCVLFACGQNLLLVGLCGGLIGGVVQGARQPEFPSNQEPFMRQQPKEVPVDQKPQPGYQPGARIPWSQDPRNPGQKVNPELPPKNEQFMQPGEVQQDQKPGYQPGGYQPGQAVNPELPPKNEPFMRQQPKEVPLDQMPGHQPGGFQPGCLPHAPGMEKYAKH